MAHAPSHLRRGSPVPELVATLGGATLAVGSFLTWVSATIGLRGFAETLGVDVSALNGADIPTRSAAGIDLSDGKVTLLAGILVVIGAAIAYVAPRRRTPGVMLIVLGGSAGAARALTDLLHVDRTASVVAQRVVNELVDLGFTKADVDRVASNHAGIGLWLCLAGGVVALAGGLMLFLRVLRQTCAGRRIIVEPDPSSEIVIPAGLDPD
jgi:hypothetical protein